jgi:hypothetical protein
MSAAPRLVPANNMIIVPNAKLAQAIRHQLFPAGKAHGDDLVVTVGYDCDPDAVEQLLADVVNMRWARYLECSTIRSRRGVRARFWRVGYGVHAHLPRDRVRQTGSGAQRAEKARVTPFDGWMELHPTRLAGVLDRSGRTPEESADATEVPGSKDI